jgi:hypothetical protein
MAALRLRAPVGGVDLALGEVLDRAVEREHHALAGRGRLQHGLGDHLAAERVAADHGLAGVPTACR